MLGSHSAQLTGKSVRGFLISASLVAFTSTAATAADLPALEPAPVIAPVSERFDWTGFYIGAQGGGTWGEDDFFISGEEPIFGDASFDLDGPVAGGHVGFNFGWNAFVLGLEADGEWAEIEGDFEASNGDEVGTEIDWQASIRGRIGFGWDRVLVYATGGGAFAGIENRVFNASADASDTEEETRIGWTAGAGVDVALTRSIITGVEYRYADYGEENFEADILPLDEFESDVTTHTVRGRISFKFGALAGM